MPRPSGIEGEMEGTPVEAAGGLLDDREVARRVVAGERGLFEVLMRRYDQRLFRTVRAVLRDEDEAEDALQQAWIRIYTRLDQYEGEAPFATWATRVALNEALMRRRDRARRAGTPAEVDPHGAPPQSPDDRAAAREAVALVEQAIDLLPTGYRTVLVLRDLEGLSTAEVASSLGLSEAVVKKRLERARHALRDAVLAHAGLAAPEVFAFRGARCAAMVAAVMARVLDT